MEEFAKPPLLANRPVKSERPLLGLTILLVEDSRYFSDAVRLMAIRSGARLRRADCLASARKHVRIYRPDAILVDLGLPDGSGQDFIKELSHGVSTPPIIAMSGATDRQSHQAALQAGAVHYLQKPFFDLAAFQQTILSVVLFEEETIKFQPRLAGETIFPDDESLSEDFHQIRDIIRETVPTEDCKRMIYCAQFVSSVAQVSGDTDLAQEADYLRKKLQNNEAWKNSCARLVELLDKRLVA